MLNIRWTKNEAGCLLAVWAPHEPGKPAVVSRGTDPAISPARNRAEFHMAKCCGLRKAA
jgi:hypothetical protein